MDQTDLTILKAAANILRGEGEEKLANELDAFILTVAGSGE